ncbi:zinc finger protein 257-like [Anthonomus grandis grandis]|uniref:zinc finger protein 257-like n=1 Tax=Anthonomus grandis grandis TaxID=2921223 RepID=UPI0021669B64|nr:zinc finger protein 257-like [Anthonomus grandis grandis]
MLFTRFEDGSAGGAFQRLLDVRCFKVESITIKEEPLYVPEESTLMDPAVPPKTPKPKKYRCDVCMAGFKKKSVFNAHMSNHTKQIKYECDQCSAVFYKKKSADEHRKEHEDFEATGVFCTVCKIWCKSLRSLLHHKKTHDASNTKNKTYNCNLCPSSFNTTLALKEHKSGHHQLERRHVCEQCGQGFLFVNHLTTHMISHSEERKFPCAICGNKFKRKEHLSAHQRTHEKEQERGLRTYQT